MLPRGSRTPLPPAPSQRGFCSAKPSGSCCSPDLLSPASKSPESVPAFNTPVSWRTLRHPLKRLRLLPGWVPGHSEIHLHPVKPRAELWSLISAAAGLTSRASPWLGPRPASRDPPPPQSDLPPEPLFSCDWADLYILFSVTAESTTRASPPSWPDQPPETLLSQAQDQPPEIHLHRSRTTLQNLSSVTVGPTSRASLRPGPWPASRDQPPTRLGCPLEFLLHHSRVPGRPPELLPSHRLIFQLTSRAPTSPRPGHQSTSRAPPGIWWTS